MEKSTFSFFCPLNRTECDYADPDKLLKSGCIYKLKPKKALQLAGCTKLLKVLAIISDTCNNYNSHVLRIESVIIQHCRKYYYNVIKNKAMPKKSIKKCSQTIQTHIFESGLTQ